MSDVVQDRWSLVIVSSREKPDTLMATINAAVNASASHDIIIDVIVNGNRALADTAKPLLSALTVPESREGKLEMRLWFIAEGDKAHTWNTYIHDIWPGSSVAFFVDGYARVGADAFQKMVSELKNFPNALAASGVPSVGRSAKAAQAAMAHEGGIQGSLFALTREGIEGLRSSEFRLPLGMYRSDGTIGAVLSFHFDPAKHKWDDGAIVVVPGATWEFDTLKWWRLADLKTQYRRMKRLAFGRFAIAAVREAFAVKRQPVSSLPEKATDMVRTWMQEHPKEKWRVIRQNPLWLFERQLMQNPRDWSRTSIPPELIMDRSGKA